MGKFWHRKKLAKNELFAKILLANIQIHNTENVHMYLAHALTVAKFSSLIAFTCMARQNFLRQGFPMYGMCYLAIKLKREVGTGYCNKS